MWIESITLEDHGYASIKTIELVSYCQRRRMLARLVEVCLGLRPEIDWRAGIGVMLEREVGDVDTAVPAPSTTAFITDNNALLRADSPQERQHADPVARALRARAGCD